MQRNLQPMVPTFMGTNAPELPTIRAFVPTNNPQAIIGQGQFVTTPGMPRPNLQIIPRSPMIPTNPLLNPTIPRSPMVPAQPVAAPRIPTQPATAPRIPTQPATAPRIPTQPITATRPAPMFYESDDEEEDED